MRHEDGERVSLLRAGLAAAGGAAPRRHEASDGARRLESVR